MTLIEEIYKSLETWSNSPVIVERNPGGSEKYISAAVFKNRIEELIRVFRDAGIKEQIPVPIFVDNCWDYPSLFLALVSIGAIPVLAKKAYRQIELEYIFNDINPTVVICDIDFFEHLNKYGEDCLFIIKDNEKMSLKGNGVPTVVKTIPGTISVNYTYRGFGYPLGAMIGESGYLDAARRYQNYVCFTPGDRILALLPMSHIFTMISSVILPLLNHITTYILKTVQPKEILNTLKTCRINSLSTIPELLLLLAKVSTEDDEYPDLKVLVSGGSLLSEENHTYITDRFNVEVLNGYGLTEIAPITANLRNHGKIGSLGEFCMGLTGRIVYSADNKSGEIVVKTEDSFLGYFGRPSETASVMDGEWFRTGDFGRLQDGHILFSGEMKRTRKVNGQLVDLREVELALMKTGLVKKAIVGGETNHVHADIELTRGIGSDERMVLRTLRKALGEIIASYKVPRTFNII